MSMMRTDKDQVVTGNLHLEGLTEVDQFAPYFVADVELIGKPIAAFPIYDGDRLVGWVPIFNAEPPYKVEE